MPDDDARDDDARGDGVRGDGLGLSAILPAFEEALHLEATVDALARALEGLGVGRWEILLVVSAAARDGTPSLAARLAARDARIRVVEQPASDPGYGRALALGVSAASGAWLFFTDADGQFDFADLAGAFRHTPEADAVLGYRRVRADVAGRRVAGWLYATTVRVALGVQARDVDCAFKLVRARLLDGVRLERRTGAVNAELLGHVFARTRRVVEVAVSHLPRPTGESRFERRLGPLVVPDPREAFTIAREVGGLISARAWRRSWA